MGLPSDYLSSPSADTYVCSRCSFKSLRTTFRFVSAKAFRCKSWQVMEQTHSGGDAGKTQSPCYFKPPTCLRQNFMATTCINLPAR